MRGRYLKHRNSQDKFEYCVTLISEFVFAAIDSPLYLLPQ